MVIVWNFYPQSILQKLKELWFNTFILFRWKKKSQLMDKPSLNSRGLFGTWQKVLAAFREPKRRYAHHVVLARVPLQAHVPTGVITVHTVTIAHAFLSPSVVKRSTVWRRQPVGKCWSNSKVRHTCTLLLLISKTVEVVTASPDGSEVNELRSPGGAV